MIDIRKCPRCNANVEGKELAPGVADWECKFCGLGLVVRDCPGCGFWIVQRFEKGKPVIVECPACAVFISTI